SKKEYEKINIIQTLELAQKAKESGVNNFIFMSTVKVYGEESDTVYSENSECKPEDEYGKSKLKAEQELQKIEDDNFIVSIIRPPIVNGYGVKANIKNLINLVNKISVLPLGDIQNRRSMIYVGNLCHLIDELIQKQISGIFLASDDKPISTTRLIELISFELNKKVYLIKIPFFKEILKLVKPSIYKRLYENLELDNSATKEVLNFNNLYTVEDGIRHMING
ncbi:MAG: GDP-mannose 4,6-dehydratase, partial [Sulfurimonas sp.]|nr:GDP-mannose 4,6-dehydratase [Sulfurimonas sp.]